MTCSPFDHFVHSSSGSYELSQAEGVQPGTKIVIHLKKDCWKFAIESDVKGEVTMIMKNFVLSGFTLMYS